MRGHPTADGAARMAGLVLAFGITALATSAPLPWSEGWAESSQIFSKGVPAVRDPHIVAFHNSAFPFDGMVPEKNEPFLQTDADGRRFHDSPRGGKLFEDKTYNDKTSLVYIPPSFDPWRPGAAIVLFFHGNLATLRDVEGRQGVPRQLAKSGLNAVLLAPQLAVDALDSSPGRFYEKGFLQDYLSEAAEHLSRQSKGRFPASAFARLPIIVVAYSGGYMATAFSLFYADASSRVEGVILLDALFGEPQKIADWVVRTYPSTFFVAAFSDASREEMSDFAADLRRRDIPIKTRLPGDIQASDVVILDAPKAAHGTFVTEAWTRDPLADVLRRVGIKGP